MKWKYRLPISVIAIASVAAPRLLSRGRQVYPLLPEQSELGSPQRDVTPEQVLQQLQYEGERQITLDHVKSVLATTGTAKRDSSAAMPAGTWVPCCFEKQSGKISSSE